MLKRALLRLQPINHVVRGSRIGNIRYFQSFNPSYTSFSQYTQLRKFSENPHKETEKPQKRKRTLRTLKAPLKMVIILSFF